VHEALIDPEGPALSAVLIGGLLEGGSGVWDITNVLVSDLIGHIRGCGGGDISKQNLELSAALANYRDSGAIRGSKRLELISNIQGIATARVGMTLAGDPTADWIAVRDLLEAATRFIENDCGGCPLHPLAQSRNAVAGESSRTVAGHRHISRCTSDYKCRLASRGAPLADMASGLVGITAMNTIPLVATIAVAS